MGILNLMIVFLVSSIRDYSQYHSLNHRLFDFFIQIPDDKYSP